MNRYFRLSPLGDVSGQGRLAGIIGRIVSIVLFGTFLNLVPLSQTGEVSAAPAAPPPMSSQPDILNGERYVLPVDDIFLAMTYKDTLFDYAWRDVGIGLTNNKAISQTIVAPLSYSSQLNEYTGALGGQVLAGTGRLYDSKLDIPFTLALSDRDELYGTSAPLHLDVSFLRQYKNSLGELLIGEVLWFQLPITTPAQPRAITVADWTGDGLHDVAFHVGSTETPGSSTIIGTATDGTKMYSNLRFGPEYFDAARPAYLDMKAGDLNGDGRPELIGLYHTATDLRVVVHTVDPSTLQILDPTGNDYKVMSWNTADRARLAVGKFDDDMGDAEIVVVHGDGAGGGACPSGTYCSVWVTPLKVSIAAPPPTGTGEVSFAQGVTADIGPVLNGSTGSNWKYLIGLEAATGKLDWFGGEPRDQLVVAAGMSSDSHYRGYAAVVVNFVTDATSSMSISTDQVKASAYNNKNALTTCLTDVQIGRFSPPSPDGETPANAQVALLLTTLGSDYSPKTSCGKDVWDNVVYSDVNVGIYSVDPANDFNMTSTSSNFIPHSVTVYTPPRMAVGDFQGRSLLLGQPMIISMANQIQPQFVIGAPPMHLDYFKPPLATSDRPECYAAAAKVYGQEPTSPTTQMPGDEAVGCIQNVSAYPGQSTGGATAACDYCARFSMSGDATHAGWQESTTSHTWSNEFGGSSSYTFGTLKPNAFQKGGLQLELHGGAKAMHSNTQTTRDETLAETKINLDTSTGVDDVVLFSSQDVYLYMYPVIGQTDDNGNPIYLSFSVPDQTVFHSGVIASSLPWFQPPHEVGNIFSYPGNQEQLKTDYPGAADRSGAVSWSASTTTNAVITWIEGDSETKTAGSVDRTEWNVGTSVTAAAKVEGFTIKDTLKYDHNESTANQYMNTNKKTLSKSEGFSVTSAGFTAVADSDYQIEARILGSETPPLASDDADASYWDAPVPMPDPEGAAGDGFVPNLTLDGPMHLVYTTDMLSSTSFHAGGLWHAVYSAAPDIALQHPKRFIRGGRDSTAPLSDWWKFVPLYDNIDLSSIYLADFLKMKGFFINPASALPGQGPQMTMAVEGTKLRLAARIYNYSLADLPAGATVKVRFYAHQLATDGNAWTPGECTLIGEDDSITSDVIRGFSNQGSVAANRAMAETIFDTTGRGGQYLVFWVAAWAENADGTLVAELPQHGLSSIPPAGCMPNSILDMPMEFYSNNVGFYEQPFYVMTQALAPAPLPTAKSLRPFSISALTVSPASAKRPYAGELWELQAPLQAGDQDALGVHLVHAGKGPGGRVSNTGIIQFIEAGQTYTDHLIFRPLWCGPHSAMVTARPAFRDPVSATLDFEIACRPEDVTAFFNDVLSNASLAGAVSINKNGRVQGRLAALQNAVLTAERLAHKGATKGACEQYSHALVRTADAGNGPMAQLLEDIIENARGQLGCR